DRNVTGVQTCALPIFNAPGQDEIARHLTQFDTVHGRFNAEVSLTDDKQHLVVNGDQIRLLSERDPAKLPWDELDIDIVLECTGQIGRSSCRERVTRLS